MVLMVIISIIINKDLSALGTLAGESKRAKLRGWPTTSSSFTWLVMMRRIRRRMKMRRRMSKSLPLK